jgi:hypothetical protein
MPNRLLDRQASLLAYLTSRDAIFGDRTDAPLARELQGIDPALLHLEARFSYEKRLEKIASVFPRTLAILGDGWGPIFQDFVDACPPMDVTRLANARQFHEFLLTRWRRDPPQPAYLPDVAACELARAEVRRAHDEPAMPAANERSRRGIRRRPGIVLLRCGYDIRPIFEPEGGNADPPKRDTALAVAMPPAADQPGVFELLPPVFDFLAALDDWIDPATLEAARDFEELIRDLAAHGLLEVRA